MPSLVNVNWLKRGELAPEFLSLQEAELSLDCINLHQRLQTSASTFAQQGQNFQDFQISAVAIYEVAQRHSFTTNSTRETKIPSHPNRNN